MAEIISKMATPTLLFLLLAMSMLVEARHLHVKLNVHRGSPEDAWGDETEEVDLEAKPAMAVKMDVDNDELAPIDIIKNVKPIWFVPINSKYYFGFTEPCVEGHKRDRFGVCREVW